MGPDSGALAPVKRGSRQGGPSGFTICQLGGDDQNNTRSGDAAQLARLPRRLLRKIVVEPTADGWRARIVGFDARFWNGAVSSAFSTRHMALAAARAASRVCGLPVITIETLAPSGPDLAA